MEVNPASRVYLESLTTTELIVMADNMGIDMPPDLDRIFIIEELLDIASVDAAEDTGDFSDSPAAPAGVTADSESGLSQEAGLSEFDMVESVPLPKQYNITSIGVIIRDPFWAFVFWEVKTQDRDQFEQAQDFDGYYLKVVPFAAAQEKPAGRSPDKINGKPAYAALPDSETDAIFRVPVSPNDTSWYLGLNPEAKKAFQCQNDQCRYKVELTVSLRGNETILAVSGPFRLPLLHELPAGGGKQDASVACGNPLVLLSGYEDFNILRSKERLFRTKRSGAAGSYG